MTEIYIRILFDVLGPTNLHKNVVFYNGDFSSEETSGDCFLIILSRVSNEFAAVMAESALFKECHFIPKKEQKWHIHPQLKNILLHILPLAQLCKSLKNFPAQPSPVEFQKSSVTTSA